MLRIQPWCGKWVIFKEEGENRHICAMRKDCDNERADLKRLKKQTRGRKAVKMSLLEQRENNNYIIVATSSPAKLNQEEKNF